MRGVIHAYSSRKGKNQVLRIGIGGPVGSGKTAAIVDASLRPIFRLVSLASFASFIAWIMPSKVMISFHAWLFDEAYDMDANSPSPRPKAMRIDVVTNDDRVAAS